MTGISTTRAGDVADQLDLMSLSARAARCFDEGDADGYADCFTADGLYESPRIGLRAQGRDELRAMCDSRQGRDVHFVSNFEIAIDGDEARIRCSLLLALRTGDTLVSTTGYYQNRCVRTTDGWRFTHKVSILDRRGPA